MTIDKTEMLPTFTAEPDSASDWLADVLPGTLFPPARENIRRG